MRTCQHRGGKLWEEKSHGLPCAYKESDEARVNIVKERLLCDNQKKSCANGVATRLLSLL